MKPIKEKLLHLSRAEIAEKFGVSGRTVVRWMKHYGLFERCGSGKLSIEKAKEMRLKHAAGSSIKLLAEEYDVTFSAASRAIHYLTYDDRDLDLAKVSVVYNPH